MNSKFDYEQLKQKLEDAMKFGTKELDETKAAKAAAEEAKAVAENDLAVAEKATAEGSKHLSDLQNECMTKATEYEESQHSRQEELTALATAKKILEEKTGGASGLPLAELLQVPPLAPGDLPAGLPTVDAATARS